MQKQDLVRTYWTNLPTSQSRSSLIDNTTGAADFLSSTLPSEGALPADASQKMRCQMSSCQISHPRNLQRPSQLSLARLKSSCLSQRLASMLKHCFCPKILDLVLEQVYVAIWMSAVPQQGGRHTPPPRTLHRHGESGRRRFIAVANTIFTSRSSLGWLICV